MPSGVAYTYTLLNKWEEIIELGEKYRENYMENRADLKIARQYISKLTRMWLELYPKLKGRTEADLEDLVKHFEDYRVFYTNPKLLLMPSNAAKLFKLEEATREALEKLKITKFEDTEL